MKTLATGLLVLLSLLVAENSIAQQGINVPPDTIFFNGKIITVDSGFAIQQAFAVRGEQYAALGTNAAIRALAGANTRLVDLEGSAVIPGLTDNHDHLYNSAKVMRGIDLVGATSTAEVVRRLRDGLARAKPGETVFGSVGWRAPLTRQDLDQISVDVPIVALRARRGAAVMNSAALKKAEISKEMQSYMGKEIPKDGSGELTGETPDYPAGLHAVDKVVPLPTLDEEEKWIEVGQKQRNALGITSTRDLSNWPAGMRAFVRMWRQGRLTIRVSMGLELAVSDPAGLARAQIVTPGFGDHWLRIDSAGERPHAPEGDATPEQYKALMLELNRLGWRHSPHVGSNEALEAILQAYEAADRESPIRDKRWVVEHIPNVTPPLMERLAKLGVIVSTNMAGYGENYDAAVRALGREQAERQTPVKEMLDHHLLVVNGSDYGGPSPETTTSNNPFVPLYYYVSRKTRDGRVLGAQEKISREEALRIATNYNRTRKARRFPGSFRGFHDHPGGRNPQAASAGDLRGRAQGVRSAGSKWRLLTNNEPFVKGSNGCLGSKFEAWDGVSQVKPAYAIVEYWRCDALCDSTPLVDDGVAREAQDLGPWRKIKCHSTEA